MTIEACEPMISARRRAGATIVWTPEKTEALKKLWAEGYTASQIAGMMGAASRSAICGAVHRMGLANRGRVPGSGRKPIRNASEIEARGQLKRHKNAERMRQRYAVARGLQPPTVRDFQIEAPMPPYAGSLNLPFAELRDHRKTAQNQCRFIEGPAPDYRSCGSETPIGRSYCVHHQKDMTQRPEQRRTSVPESNRRGAKISNLMGSYEL
jgi:GcrA cell cycle regulator